MTIRHTVDKRGEPGLRWNRVYHWYREDVRDNRDEQLNIQLAVHKRIIEHLVSIRLHAGGRAGEYAWAGHLILFGLGLYWSFTGFRRLSTRVTSCKTYSSFDTRTFYFGVIDGFLNVDLWIHDGYCRRKKKAKRGKFRRGSRRWVVDLSILNHILGPKRYTYAVLDTFLTEAEFPDGSYPMLITLEQCHLGRTRVKRSKHIQSLVLSVEAEKGIPVYNDNDGGWKGDRVNGFTVPYPMIWRVGWEVDAKRIVMAYLTKKREENGFVEPDPIE